MELLIGNKNYSSWSLRGWLMLEAFGLSFKETKLQLFSDEFKATLAEHNCAGKVPLLLDGDVRVWDSLAICEYLSETRLDGKGWPDDPEARALARAVANEMHSGFNGLRSEMPMNIRARRHVELSAQANADIARIDQLWRSLRETYGSKGNFLFGRFSIADVMFAPVAFRFMTYGNELSAAAQQYADNLIAHPAMQSWMADALLETEIVEEDEAGVDR